MRPFLPLCLACIALLPGLDLDTLAAPPAGTLVVDLAGRLDADARARCQLAAAGVAGGRLMVLVVPDCGGRNPRAAGLRLFNRWGIGHAQRNDGALLLVALGERRGEFLLGSGIDDDANVLRSQAIVDRRMLPLFRSGDIAGGVVAGTEAAARELFGHGSAPTTADVDVERVTPAPAPAPVPIPAPITSPAPVAETDYTPIHRSSGGSDEASFLRWLLAGGVTALLGGFGTLAWLRRRPRTCSACQAPMFRLDEQADDAHLASGQRCEESVGSVDYDVWACPTCPQVVITRHGSWFTRYHACPACGWKTASDRSTEEEAATELCTGRERIDTRCAHCGHHETTYRVLPRKERNRSSGFHSSSFSTSGRSSSGGGGRSSGRGGGGGW